jgi:hypothetical protein
MPSVSVRLEEMAAFMNARYDPETDAPLTEAVQRALGWSPASNFDETNDEVKKAFLMCVPLRLCRPEATTVGGWLVRVRWSVSVALVWCCEPRIPRCGGMWG